MQLSTNLRIRRRFTQHNPETRALARPCPCPVPGCYRAFKNSSGLTQHKSSVHPDYIDEPSSPSPVNPAIFPTEESSENSASGSADSDTSRQRRATVEDINDEDVVMSSNDEDDIMNSNNEETNDNIHRYYHSKLTGACY